MDLDETVFITGFPGFIAGRLIRRLERDGGRFLILVQPAFLDRAREELAVIASQAGASADRFEILEGDITLSGLGLAPKAAETARRGTTLLFHLAAAYDLGVARDLAMRVNVEGTRNVSAFAKSISGLRRYHY